jgi:hypothetical protein
MTGFYGADEAGFELPVLSTHTPAEAVTVNLGARHRHLLTYVKLFGSSPIVDASLLGKPFRAWSPPRAGSRATWTTARWVSARERANQSKLRCTNVPPLCLSLTRSRRPFPAGIEPTFKFTSENLTFITTKMDK